MFGVYKIAAILFFIKLCNSQVSINNIITNDYTKETTSSANNKALSPYDLVLYNYSANVTKEEGAELIHTSPIAEDVIGTIGVGEIYETTTVSNSDDERGGYVTHSAVPGGRLEGVYEQPASGMAEVLESDHKERGGALTYQLANKNDAEINPRLNKPDAFDESTQSQAYHRNEMGDVNESSGGMPSDVQVDDFMKSHIGFSIKDYSNVPSPNSYSVDVLFNSSFIVYDSNNKTLITSQDSAPTGTLPHVSNTISMANKEGVTDIVNDDSYAFANLVPQDSLPNIPVVLRTDYEYSQSTIHPTSTTKYATELEFDALMKEKLIENETLISLNLSKSEIDDKLRSENKNSEEISIEESLNNTFKGPIDIEDVYTALSTDFTSTTGLIDAPLISTFPDVEKKSSDEVENPEVQTIPTENSTEDEVGYPKPTSNEDNHYIKNDSRNYPSNNEISIKSMEHLPTAERLYSNDNERESIKEPISEHEYPSPQTNIPLTPSRFEYIPKDENIAIKNLLIDHTRIEKEKPQPGVLFEDCSDCDLGLLPIRAAEQRSSPKQEVEHLPTPKIRFSELPEGRKLKINSLGLSNGIFLFSYLSEFLSWIQPNDFPVELLRDALKTQNSWISIITESVQVEVGFVVCLVSVVLLALAVPMVVLSHACYRMGGRGNDQEEAPGWGGNCKRRTLVFILQLLLILLFGGMVAMFATNEQLSGAVIQSSDVMQASLGDVSSFIHNAHLQLHFLVTHSVDQVLQVIYADLDNVDSLLGRPIQQELVSETGLDVALDSLGDLTREAKETTQQVDRFLDEARVAQEMLVSSRDKLSDLRQQVELFRRACGPRDRTLCDTIDATGLDITLQIDRIKSDDRLNRMRRIGSVALETAAREAKEHYLSVPNRVEVDTRDAREAVRRQLSRQRADIDESSKALEQFARDMTTKVSDVKYEVGSWMQHVDEFEYWRWIACVGGGAAVLMIWSMLLSSMCCGCCGSEKAAGPTILLTVVLVCLFSTVLWSMVLVGLLVGGHGEVFVCRPLYDEPEYRVITDLVDHPGVFYTNTHGGFIANVLYGNETLDVPIKQVLQDCHDNRAIYPTLGLHRVFNVEAAVDQHRWSNVGQHLRAVRANLSSLEVLSPHLQDQLSDLLATLSVNFTDHRIQMSKPVTGKDLDSFARQLDNIGNQMRDLATASRMETLSSRTRRLIDSHIRPLEGKKDSLVYQLTALEVQTGPLQRQVNQSLSHLKTIQFFINSQGEAIAHRKSREFVERLVSYVDQLREHVVDAAMTSVSPCRPLWDIFHSTRLFLCRHTMDPLNGFWFATMWCLLVLLVATPVCLKLVDYYRVQSSRSSGSPTENLMIAEQGAGWSSPGYDIKCSKKCDS